MAILERKPIITNYNHCARAVRLVESETLYFGLGRTSQWPGESEAVNDEEFLPPLPDADADGLDELIGLKKADRVIMVMPDPRGNIVYENQTFKTLSIEDAIKNKARWVLVETTIFSNELPAVEYRQIGIFSRVKPRPGSQNKDILLPNEIESTGILEVLANRKVITRQSNTRDKYFMIIEF